MNYADPVISAYIELIRANTGEIKEFYQGEPIRVPASNFPCAIISKRQTRVAPASNAEDEHGIALSITIIADVRKDLSSDDSAVTAGIGLLYDLVEGRNADLTLKENSLLGILRGNLLVDDAHGLRTDLGAQTVVDYGLTLRDRAPEAWSIEARVDIVASFHQVR
jgi:hypothetical protein